MNTVSKLVAMSGLALALAGPATAGVTVNYLHPENYADLPLSAHDRDWILDDLSDHFKHMGRKLPAGQELKVEILDLDLAGRVYPSIRFPDMRVLMGGADWPHIHLRYTLESGGTVLKQGEEHLSNMMYLNRINIYSSGDVLRYEKQMLDDWFKGTILRR